MKDLEGNDVAQMCDGTVEMFKEVTDVAGETKFMVESVGNVDRVEMVRMKDLEGNDIAQMCVDLDMGVKIDEVFESSIPQSTVKDENVSQKTMEPKEKKNIEKTISTPQSKEKKEIETPVSTPLKASSNGKKIEPPPKVERVGEKPLSPKPKIKISSKRDESSLKYAPADKKEKESNNNESSKVEKKQEFRKENSSNNESSRVEKKQEFRKVA